MQKQRLTSRRPHAHRRPTSLASLACAMAFACLGVTPPASAQSQPLVPAVESTRSNAPSVPTSTARQPVALPAQPLVTTLERLARQFDAAIGADSAHLDGIIAPAIQGEFSLSEALQHVLDDSGLQATTQGPANVVVEPRRDEGRTGARQISTLAPITVRSTAWALNLAPDYSGGQVARGSRLGVLGNQDFMDTPFATTSYTERFIRERQARDLGEVVGASDASVYVPARRNIQEAFQIRGFSLTAFDSTFNGLSGMAPVMRSSTEMAERVEVFKGPTAFLTGMPPEGSLGGSVNIVPKRAHDAPLTRISTSVDSDSLLGVHADVGRRFGTDNQFGIRVNGVHRSGDTAVQHERNRMQLASVALDWDSGNARLSADIYRQKERLDGANYFGVFGIADTVTRLPAPRHGDHSLAPSWAYSINDSRVIVLRGEIDLTDDWTAYAAWGRNHGGYDALITMNDLLDDAGNLDSSAIRQRYKARYRNMEFGVQGHLRTGSITHTLNIAANRYREGYGTAFLPFSGHATTNIGAPDFGSAPDLSGFDGSLNITPRRRLNSVAVADTMGFANGRVQLTLGARHQRVQSSDPVSHYDESRLSPAAGLLVKPLDDLAIHANYIEGLSQGESAPDTAANYGDVLKPYQTRQVEIGAKYDFGRFASSFSLWQIRRPSAFTDPDTRVFGVYGKQRNRGIEWNIVGEVIPGLRVMGGVAYTRATMLRSEDDASKQRTQIVGVPKLVARLGVDHELRAIRGLSLNGNVNHVGKRHATLDNRLSMDAYTTLDIGARYQARAFDKPVTLHARINNLTNEAYWLGSWRGIDGSGLSGGLGSPRTFVLGASIDF